MAASGVCLVPEVSSAPRACGPALGVCLPPGMSPEPRVCGFAPRVCVPAPGACITSVVGPAPGSFPAPGVGATPGVCGLESGVCGPAPGACPAPDASLPLADTYLPYRPDPYTLACMREEHRNVGVMLPNLPRYSNGPGQVRWGENYAMDTSGFSLKTSGMSKFRQHYDNCQGVVSKHYDDIQGYMSDCPVNIFAYGPQCHVLSVKE